LNASAKEELKKENDIVYVPVQIAVCRTGAERYYDLQTLRYREEMERKLKTGAVKLEEVGKVYQAGPC